MSDVRLSPAGEVLDEQGEPVLRIRGFQFRPPSETKWKRIELEGTQMYCEGEPLGELGSLDLEVTGELDEGGSVSIQFPR
jgi:hypothetical protein